jgi:NADH dehydrogenase
VASSLLNPSDIAYPVRTVFRRVKNVAFRTGEVVGVDLEARRVRLGNGTDVPYDHLVLATGSETTHFGMDDVASFSLGLKDLPEAMQLRNHILSCFEAAAGEEDPEARARRLTFVVVGGGPTGVEYAGALSELIRLVLRKDFPELDMDGVRIVLVEALDQVFPMFRDDLREYAAEELKRRRIELRLGVRVEGGRPGALRLSDGETLESHTVVWAAGVRPSPLIERLDVPTSDSGRIVVSPELRVLGREDVWAIGDIASFVENRREIPMLAPPAMQQAKVVARNILALARGKKLRAFHYRDKGLMATIGRKAAVAEVGSWGIRGWFGWVAWLLLHVLFMIGFRNRLTVLIGWAWEYVRYDRPVRLIARARGPMPSTPSASCGRGRTEQPRLLRPETIPARPRREGKILRMG